VDIFFLRVIDVIKDFKVESGIEFVFSFEQTEWRVVRVEIEK
jgi:hypothetical protein